MTKLLIDALLQRQREYRDAVSFLEQDGAESSSAAEKLREAIELVGCLRRLIPHCTLEQIHKAFGAPGDFGYETPIGDALSRVYRGESAAESKDGGR